MHILILFLIFTFCLRAEENEFILLSGHLSKEHLQPIQRKVEALKKSPLKNLGIVVQSTSGDLEAVFDLSEELYALKQTSGTHVTLYIDDRALGPSAIFPFLADNLEGSAFFVWGDIPLSAEKSL